KVLHIVQRVKLQWGPSGTMRKGSVPLSVGSVVEVVGSVGSVVVGFSVVGFSVVGFSVVGFSVVEEVVSVSLVSASVAES
ncbi:MAG: hypothetical protein ACPG4T_15815, partial [Nannocystaceae bacterium]